MRRTPDGEYYFFEVNTAGEFLFIEDLTGSRLPERWRIACRTAGGYVTFLSRIVVFCVAEVTG